MVQFLDSFGKDLGAGIGQGLSAATQFGLQMKLKEKEKADRLNLINQVEGTGSTSKGDLLKGSQENDIRQKFLEVLPEIEKMKGSDLTPEDLDSVWAAMSKQKVQEPQLQSQTQQQDPISEAERKAKAYAAAGEHDLSRFETEKSKSLRKERSEELNREFKKEQAGEKSIEEIQDRLQGTELSDLRQEKLQNLFSKSKEIQFPSSILAAAFTKDGELNPVALSQLSPDAQEAVKLLADEVRGVKDTFGSQISGFEVRRWLARLPSLLNTAEGKRRVINDLRMMNKFSMDADQGVLDIIDRYGGPGKISVSKAKGIYKKENAQKIKEMRQAFINPESAEFSELPDASMFSGREIEDPETGQIFKSNGKEWVPQ